MPGSEELCPCGSGMPYDVCCGADAVFSLEQAKWRRAGLDLRRALGEFADRSDFAWDAARAQEIYMSALEKYSIKGDDDFTMERCFEWFIFDYKLSSGLTVMETFWEEKWMELNSYEAVLVKEWSRSPISLYEVTATLPEKGLLSVKDLLMRRKFVVRDAHAASNIEPGSLLFIRVLRVGSEYEFSTTGLALPGDLKEHVLNMICRDRQEYARSTGSRSWAQYLRERSSLLNAWIMEAGLLPKKDEEVRDAGEILKCIDVIPLKDGEALINEIDSFPFFIKTGELLDKNGLPFQVSAAVLGDCWVCTSPGGVEKALGRTGICGIRAVLGRVLVSQKFAVVTAANPRLLEKCKEILSEAVEYTKGGDGTGAQESLHQEKDDFVWPEPGYAVVAGRVRDGLEALGYSRKQQKSAIKLWYDYCSMMMPIIRKTAVWTATVIYAFAQVEVDKKLNQQDLAWRYGVSSSAISSNYRQICRILGLVPYDRRYSTKRLQVGLSLPFPLDS